MGESFPRRKIGDDPKGFGMSRLPNPGHIHFPLVAEPLQKDLFFSWGPGTAALSLFSLSVTRKGTGLFRGSRRSEAGNPWFSRP
ncbi:hypothetical protein DRJ58_00070 [Candidatus Acetothermia bacterium]|nr:MAG: hypothetical protein DRJ58_00070 [Candidatus Acetothermia bacterium]